MAGNSVSFKLKYHHAKEVSRNFKIFINESEMEQIKKWTLMKDNIETGGDLFGLWIDKHTAVVQFVLGPGENCKRTSVSFFQDTEYLEKAGTFLTNSHGLCNIGQWHSHHRLSLNKPSAGDENTVWGNMPSLRLNRYIVFIANIGGIASTNEANVNCFLFEIQNGGRRPVLEGKFNVLAGKSPFHHNKLVLQNVLQGQEKDTKMRLAERRTINTFNKTDDIENESKLRGINPEKAHGKSESRPKISPPSKRKCEETYSKEREKDEGRLVTTTAGELHSGEVLTPTITYVQESPSRQQDANYTDNQKKYNLAPSKQEVDNCNFPIYNSNKISADQQTPSMSKEHKYQDGSKTMDQTPSAMYTQGIDNTCKSETVAQQKLGTSERRLSLYENYKPSNTTAMPLKEINTRNTPPEKTSEETQDQEPCNEKPEDKRSCCSCHIL